MNIFECDPVRTLSYDRYHKELEYRLKPDDLCEGADYLARLVLKRPLAIRYVGQAFTEYQADRSERFAAEFRVRIQAVGTEVKRKLHGEEGKTLFYVAAPEKCVSVSFAPESLAASNEADYFDHRWVTKDGMVQRPLLIAPFHAHGGYFTSSIDEHDFDPGLWDSMPQHRPTPAPELIRS